MAEIDIVNAGFLVRCPYDENWRIQACPERSFHRPSKAWVVPITNTNKKYLQENFEEDEFTPLALAELEPDPAPQDTPFPAWYPWRTKPLIARQREVLDRAYKKHAFALFHEMGLGKTWTVIQLASAMTMEGEINGVLVICQTPIKDVWEEEIRKHMPEVINPSVYVIESGKRGFDDWSNREHDGLKILVAGTEAMSQGGAYLKCTAFLKNHRAMVVMDEAGDIANDQATRTERIIDFSNHAPYRIIMDGTPINQGLHDLYAKYRFLDWTIIGSKTFFGFKNRYCYMGGYKGGSVIGYKNTNELMKLIAPYTDIARKADILDLPPKIYENMYVEPTAEQNRVTEELRTYFKADMGDESLSAETVLERMTRFQQLAGGFFPYDDGERDAKNKVVWKIKPLEGRNPKMEAMIQALELVEHKAIIWAKFRPEIELIVSHLESVYGAGSAVQFHGGVDKDERVANVQAFQNMDSQVRFMVSNQQTGGLGQTWTAANHSIYYSNSFSYRHRMQSEDRNHGRLNKLDNKVTYVDIWVKLRIEGAITKAQAKKADIAGFFASRMMKGQF